MADSQSTVHIDEAFTLHDIFHPSLGGDHISGEYHRCLFTGPGVVTIRGDCRWHGCHFADCDFVIVKPGSPGSKVHGCVWFEQADLTDCHLEHMTFLLSPKLATEFQQAAGGAIQFISGESWTDA